MELRHLRYFLAVAEEGTLTRAAERLGIQQPPLGQQIRALEDELGVELFDRAPKRITLNAAGAIFLADARRVLDEVNEMVKHVQRFERGEQGKVALGFTSSASLHWLAPEIIREFRRVYPRAELEVEERETYELMLGVLERRLDAAFMRVDAHDQPELEAHVLDTETLMAAIPIGHVLADTPETPLKLQALEGERVIFYPRSADGPGFLKDIMKAIADRGVTVEVVDIVQRILSALNLVAAGRGITVVPASMRGMHPEAIVYRPIDGLHKLPLCLVHRRDVDLKLARNFLAIATGFVPGRPAGSGSALRSGA